MKTRIGILGYGNLGRGVECAVRQNNDMELVAVIAAAIASYEGTSVEGFRVRSIKRANTNKWRKT